MKVGEFLYCYENPNAELAATATMAVSDNTSANEHRRWEELYQQMQNSMEEFREQQGPVNEQMRELITGLSRQVLQIANSPAGSGEGSSGNFNHSLSRLSRVEFPKFWGEDAQGWIYKCHSLRLVI